MSAPASPVGGMHVPCCTAHGVEMTCARYRRTHFVEVRPCCAVDAAAMKAESEARFEAQVMAGPIVDNASDRLYAIGELEYDGPRCADEDCDTPVADDDARCDDCASRCTDCGRDVSRPGRCFDCDVRSSYVGGFAPRFGAQP